MSEFEPISIDESTTTAPTLTVVPEPEPEPEPEDARLLPDFPDAWPHVADQVIECMANLRSRGIAGEPDEATFAAISANLIELTAAVTELTQVAATAVALMKRREAARQAERAQFEAKLEDLITRGLALIGTPTVPVHPGPEPKARKAKAPPKAVRRKSSTGKRAR